jgi:antitoxin MazE
MVTKIQKWENSLGVRIPKSFALEADIQEGVDVDISAREGEIVIRRSKKPSYKLEDLLAKVSRRNIHEEIDFGDSVGWEVGNN